MAGRRSIECDYADIDDPIEEDTNISSLYENDPLDDTAKGSSLQIKELHSRIQTLEKIMVQESKAASKNTRVSRYDENLYSLVSQTSQMSKASSVIIPKESSASRRQIVIGLLIGFIFTILMGNVVWLLIRSNKGSDLSILAVSKT